MRVQLILVCLCMALLASAAPAAASPVPISGDGERLLRPDGAPFFLLGVNYEGPADRAWQMWAEDRFDPALIDADLARAATAGATTLRVFVQAPLAREIAAGRWEKLDHVVGLAERRGLSLVVTLLDYVELDIRIAARTAAAVAARYRGRIGVLALDLKNEPRFHDLALARYPSPPPLQTTDLITRLGERLPRSELAAYRQSEEGQRSVPASLSDDAAWLYANYLTLYREMLAEGSAWVRERGFRVTTLDYLDDPAAARWRPLVDALDATLRAWLAPQVEAVRAADAARPLTVGHVDAILARLPANRLLDYHTLHRYAAPTAAGLRGTIGLLAAMRAALPGRPHVLGEFGHATESLDPRQTALHETATFISLHASGAAGGAKWMLNDLPPGHNMRERTLGAFRVDGSAKPVVPALAALRAYLDASGSPPGELSLEDDPRAGLRYVYRASDALLLGGSAVDGGAARMEADPAGQAFVTWSRPGEVRIWAGGPLRLHLRLDRLPGVRLGPRVLLARMDGDREVEARAVAPGEMLTLEATVATTWIVRSEPRRPRAVEVGLSDGRFYSQAAGRTDGGFAVRNADGVPFWDAFQALGGPDGIGFPVGRRFVHDGFVVQAFQKAVLQWRPDQGGAVWRLNTFDLLHERGKDDWLAVRRQTPPPFSTAEDAGLPWEQVVRRHLALLDRVPAPLRDRFLSEPDWMEAFGLPTAVQEYPALVVVRAQRAALQLWKEDVPWARKGDVTIANGGDLAREAGLWPWLAVTPENLPWDP